MEDIFLWFIRRFRPRVGWPQTLLALCAALCPAFVAGDSALRLPAGLFFWAGLLGLAIGMRGGRPPTTDHRPPMENQEPRTKNQEPRDSKNQVSGTDDSITQNSKLKTQNYSIPHHPITPSPHHPSPVT